MEAQGHGHRLQSIVAAFLPTQLTNPTAIRSDARCGQGLHRWRAVETSLRSARTGYTRKFCRFCTASEPCERLPAARAAVRYGRAGMPLPA